MQQPTTPLITTPHTSVPKLATIYTVAILALFLSVTDQALGHAEMLPTSPTLMCIALLSPFSIARIVKSSLTASPSNILYPLSANALPLTPLVLVSLVALLLAALPGTYWAEGAKWVFLIPYGVCIVLLSAIMGTSQIIRVALPVSITVSSILLNGSVWYDTIHPGTFAAITNRAAGFPGNANFAALVAVMLCAAGLNLGKTDSFKDKYHKIKRRGSGSTLNFILIVLTFCTICLTMSRSGALNFTILFVIFLWYRFIKSDLSNRQKTLELAVILSLGAVAFISVLTFSTANTAAQGSSRLTRLMNAKQVDDGSAATRIGAFWDGVELVEKKPILGHGTGFSRTMSELPHNIYLQQWINNGALGLASYLLFLAVTLITFIRRGSHNGVALLAVAISGGVFTHNILDQRPFLILLGIMLGGSAQSQLSQGNG
jgi:O-antigen ligase